MSSPEQSLVSNLSSVSLDVSACEGILQAERGGAEGGVCLGESPGVASGLSPTLSSPQLLMSVPSSTPTSPHMPHSAATTGRKLGGMKKRFLRSGAPPLSATPQATPPPSSSPPEVAAGDPLESADQSNRAQLLSRVLRPVRIRHFRRPKRRSDKQYHSDDGYTSDPGLIREEQPSDEETDGDVDSAELRRLQQIRDLERKVEKARQVLLEEEEVHNDLQSEYLQGMESTMSDKAQQRIRSRFHTRHVKLKSNEDQLRKKVDKYEMQLQELREGGAAESQTYRGRLRGRIEGSLRGMTSGLKGRLSNAGSRLMRKRNVGESIPDAEEGEDDDDLYEEDMGQDSDLIADGSQTFNDDPELGQGLESVEEAGEDGFMSEQEKLRMDMEEQKAHITHLEEQVSVLIEKLEQQRETEERLEGQLNDLTDLHQHEVDELRAQLNQVENMTISKNQDLEDAVEECRSEVESLDVLVHRQIDTQPKLGGPMALSRKVLAGSLTFILFLVAFVLATTQKMTSILQTKLGLCVTVLTALAAVILYFVSHWDHP